MAACLLRVSGGAQEFPVPAAAGAFGAAERRGVTGRGLAGLWSEPRLGELARARLPPLRNLLLEVQDLEFYIGEPTVIFIDNIFESIVRRYHP